jgi:acetylornithine deacetylase/succinyl-diaminopimelate desuccinylase-like protein
VGGTRRRGFGGRRARQRDAVNTSRSLAALGMTAVLSSAAVAQQDTKTFHDLGHAILRELIETNTTGSSGNTSELAEQLSTRLRISGFPAADIVVVGPTTKNMNLVVRYRGAPNSTKKPILLLAHLDVVEARKEDWTYDPFRLTEVDGYFYGRGTQDVKGGAATLITTLLRLKAERFVPDRDLILALTAGEEGGMPYNGVEWLLQNRRNLIDAEYTINVDAGGGEMENGKHTLFDVQAAEKVFHSVSLTVRNSGGHSSLPRRDNAIYALARALDRLSKFDFPAKTSEITRAYFAKAASAAKPAVAADMRRVASGSSDPASIARLSRDPFYNALLRTTCVATMLEGGHAENALPQTAKATVNCRMLPGSDPVDVERTILRVVNDSAVHLVAIDTAQPSPPSPLRPDLFTAIDASVKAIWGSLPIVPFMETGATDGLYLRNAGIPVYGFTGLFIPTNDIRAHGKDERLLIKSFDDGLDFMYDLLKRVAR